MLVAAQSRQGGKMNRGRKIAHFAAGGGALDTAQGLPAATPATGYTPGPETNAAGSWGAAAESGGIAGDPNISQVGAPPAWTFGGRPAAITFRRPPRYPPQRRMYMLPSKRLRLQDLSLLEWLKVAFLVQLRLQKAERSLTKLNPSRMAVVVGTVHITNLYFRKAISPILARPNVTRPMIPALTSPVKSMREPAEEGVEARRQHSRATANRRFQIVSRARKVE